MSSELIGQPEQNPAQPGVGERPQHPLANYQFSADEIRVFRECNTESFFQRSLPFGTALGVSTYYAVRQGYLAPNSKYGAVPKVVMSVIIGYFLGKFSYQNKCAQKIMQLPNSKLGQLLRQRKEGARFYDSLPNQSLGTGFGLPSFGSSSSDIYSDEGLRSHQQTSSLDLDTERPSQMELDDIYKPSVDDSTVLKDNPPIEPPKPSISYEDLRKRNREEYLKSRNSTVSEKPLQFSNQPIITGKPEETKPQKNKYGDDWSL